EINTYKLKYYSDGDIYTVEEEPVELSFKYGAHISDTIGMLIKEGNSFSGWKLNDGSEIPAVMPATDLNVYGRFSPLSYTVYYYVDDVFLAAQSVPFGTAINYREAPQKLNSRFSGWTYEGGDTLPQTMPASDIEIRGLFTDTFQIIYKLDGQEYQRETYVFGEPVEAIDDPQKTGYSFSGWEGLPATMPATDLDVTGRLLPNVYRLYFSAPQQGATVTGIPPVEGQSVDYIEVRYDENFIYRLNEVEGELFAFDFAGWQLDGDSFAPAKWEYTEDVTVSASWTEKRTQGLKYTMSTDGTYSVTGYSGLSTEVFIPSDFNGVTVQTIAQSAFRNNTAVTSITIHNGITRLGNHAFQNCTALTVINLPLTVQNIDAETFFGCSSLQNFTIPAGVSIIGNAPFRGCTSLSEIAVAPDNTIYKAEDGVLYSIDGKSLIQYPEGKTASSFIIPSSVETLGNYAFYNCQTLAEIQLGANITSVGCYAFAGTSISSMVLSKNVTWIGSNAFDRCSQLVSLSLPFVGSSKAEAGTSEGLFGYIFGNSYFADSVSAYQWYDALHYVRYYLPSSLVSVTLTDTQTIPYGAFSGCKTIQDIVLTRTVSIGEKAFYRCSALQSVSLPRTLTTIDTDAFNSCTSLQNLTLPLTVTSIGEFAFHNCPDLVYDYEQAGASEGDYTYVQVNSEGTDAVYLDSFVGVPGINQSIPEMFGTSEVVSIGKAFSGIAGMYTITLPFGVTSLDRNAFAGCGYLVVYARNVAKPIDWEEQWDDVKIYWNTDSVINYINYEGTNLNFYITNNEAILTRYTGTDADVTIPEMVFNGQSVVPVTTIGKYAFAGNPHVQSVIVPDSVSNIEEAAFADCQALIDITVYPSNMYYRIDNGVLYNKSGTRLIQYPAGRSNMMDGTTKMYPDFTLPSTVESIASMAFAGVNLETVTFSNVFNELGAGAFMNCDELTDVIYLNMTNITAIPQKAFFGCASLATLTLPTAIRSIADSAFDGCLQLANMNGEQGLDFSDFLYLTSIGNRAFANCASLPSVLFSSSLARIGYSAFQNCASLTTIEMPDSVLAVGNAAFSGCVGLTSAKLSSKLTAVSSLMFYDCGNLVSLTIPFIGAAGYTQETEDAVLGYLFGYTKESGVVGTVQYYGEGAEDQATYFIPEGLSYVFVTNAALIPYGAFSNISTLTEVEIADTVSEISGKAFLGCNTLESLTIPFIGANRDATSNEAVLGYLFAETDSSDPMGIRQEYGEGQEGYYLIPSTLRSITVTDATAIGYGALYQLANLIQVSFNANIVSIGENALYGCNALETLEIPFVGFARHAEGAADAVFGYLFGYSQTNEAGTVRQYYNTDESAYYYIPATLTEVTITSADLIPYGAFMNTAIASIQINDGAEELGEKAFAGNMLIQEIVLPNSLLTIRDYAFDNCLLLAFVSLNRVQTVGDYVFRGTAVQALTIPDSVTEVGEGAFSSMTALQTVSLSVYNSNLVTIGSYAFEGDTALETIALPNRLTSMGASLFKDCSALWRVSLPYLGADRNALGTPESMFGYVFNTAPAAGFDAITQTTTEGDITYYIPSSLTTLIITSATRIGAGALSGIGDLSISLNEGITIIEEKAFYGAQITSLHLPASVTILQESAFESSSITQMTFTIGSALTTICEKAFFNAALTSFAVPAGVVTIGESAFQNELFSLTSVTFATAAVLETIGRDAFEGNISLTSVTLPASLKFIENSAFENCSALSSLLFASGASLQSIGTYAFAHTALDIVNLPQTTQELGDYAFAYTTLTAIGFGTESNLKVLGDYSFAYSQLQTLTIPSGVTYVGINPFYETPVANLNLTGYQSGYKVESGVLYTKDGSVLISYPQSLEADTFAVPDGVARIDAYAFASNPYLITLSLPSDLLSIGYSAFMDCTALDTVSFRGDAKLLVIEEEAFYGCTALRIFDAPSTLVRIENSAFRNTEALTAIDLSACDALAYLGEYAFEQSGILTATLPATLAVMGKGAFKNASNLTAINLHNTDLVTVEEESFYGCVNLLSIEFPSTLETVSTNAFANCDLLSSASFAQTSLSTIGEGAFDDTALVSVALPDSLQLIGQNAFDNCTSLTAVTVPFIGLTTTAQNEEARLSYVFGNTIVRIASVTVRNTQTDIAVNAHAFQGMTALASLTLSDGVTTIAEGALADCPIQSLDLIFVGATAAATGANAVLGYLFG
ncbi:MAG: leucine-rich repeat protein, partial [Clostridia bacterium]|nr:leucine-rich repeat protein [Clostridia bacterium]